MVTRAVMVPSFAIEAPTIFTTIPVGANTADWLAAMALKSAGRFVVFVFSARAELRNRTAIAAAVKPAKL
jgi:hypothetical protein